MNFVKQLVDSSGNLSILAGAGVSRNPPASMPTSIELASQIVDEIAAHIPDKAALIRSYREYFATTPFETLMSRLYQGIGKDVTNLLGSLTKGEPNELHHFIAECLRVKVAASVVTTNFDSMIEKSLGDTIDCIKVAWRHRDLPEYPSSRNPEMPLLFKAHGSLRDPLGRNVADSILTTIESISRRAEPSTISLLKSIFNKRTLLILGYSGSDFLDVVRAVRSSNTCAKVWVDHADCSPRIVTIETSDPRIRNVLKPNDIVVRGDTTDFCRTLASQIPGFQPKSPRHIKCNTGERFVELPNKSAHLLAGFLFLALNDHEQEIAAELFTMHQKQQNVPLQLLARSHTGAGQAFERMGYPEIAAKQYRHAARSYRELNDERNALMVGCDMAMTHIDLHEYQAAFNNLENARQHSIKSADYELLNMASHGLGVLMEYENKRREADRHYETAIKSARRSQALFRLALSIGNRLENRKKMGLNTLNDEKLLDASLELQRLYSILGMNNEARQDRQLRIYAELFQRLYGPKASEKISTNSVLIELSLEKQVSSLVSST